MQYGPIPACGRPSDVIAAGDVIYTHMCPDSGRPSAGDDEDPAIAAALRRGDMLRISSSRSVAPPAPGLSLHFAALPVQHELVQHISSNVVAVGGQAGDDDKEEVAEEEERIQTQQELVCLDPFRLSAACGWF